MRHYVHGADGNKYGPADQQTLMAWKAEGRIVPTTLLEPETGGLTVQARDIPGLFPELHQAPQYPATGAPYAPYAPPPAGRSDQSQATWVYVLSGAAFVCCPVCGIIAIVMAASANSKGHPQGRTMLTVSIVCTTISMAANCLYFMAMMASSR